MLNKIKLIYVLLLFLFSCTSKNNFQNNSKVSIVTFEVNQLFFEDDQMNLELFVKIPMNVLVFNKQIDSFQSRLTVDFSILNDSNENIYFNSWDEKIRVDYYEDTKSRKKQLLKHDFSLPVGDYSIKIIINDFVNHLSFINEGDFSIKQDNSLDKDLKLYYKKNGEYLYYFSDAKIDFVDTLWFNFKENKKDKIRGQYLKLDYEFYFENNLIEGGNIFDSKKGNIKNEDFYPIPLLKKSFDQLKVEFRHNDKVETSNLYFKDRIFNSYDLSHLIGPMQYIVSFSEYMFFYNLNTDEQIEYIENFWNIKNLENLNEKSYDKFYEFYNRVEYANKTFNFINNNGWESDRGKIYIIHGKPQEITYDFNEKGEFEIWFYNTSKQFVFINKYGTYELYNRNF